MLQRAAQAVRDGLLGLTYPQECRVCGGPVESWDDGVACAACWADPTITRLIEGCACAKCGSLIRIEGKSKAAPRLCGLCSALPFGAARACGIYSGALEANILFLKVNPHLCTRLRMLIERTYSAHSEALASQVVVPVPLHRLREKQRGFNQAAIIAHAISKKFNLRLDNHLLTRSNPTERHRAGLDALDRAKSVENAFTVSIPRLAETQVLLVDDLFTTGSTVCAAATSLLEAGAQQVNVFTIARVG